MPIELGLHSFFQYLRHAFEELAGVNREFIAPKAFRPGPWYTNAFINASMRGSQWFLSTRALDVGPSSSAQLDGERRRGS